ncbi:MAG: ABC transporter permease [Candidatus Hydrogenedentes bacterium]|nr:ABC transporter permease [Candidatus Hydrogenedentota bacterium]
MYLSVIFKVAVRSLLASKLRSFLAVLGIVIGVGAVIAMTAIAAGAQSQVLNNIAAMGTDLLIVRPGQLGGRGVMSGTQQNLTVEDGRAIVKEVGNIASVAPVVQGQSQVKYYERNSQISVLGTTATYLAIRNFELERGRAMTDNETERLALVAIIGPKTAEDLMPGLDPIGQFIKVDGISFKVIGVTKSKGDQGWFNPDDQLIVPYLTAMKRLYGLDYVREIDVQGVSGADQTRLQDDVARVLRRRHKIAEGDADDFNIRNQAEIVETASSIGQTFTLLLGAIGTISLLVGGIGIMNIMLVTVTERTREIGIRKAIGAKNRDILRQFLFESVLMSLIGGVIGVVAGASVARIIGAVIAFTPEVQPLSVLVALSFAASVGVFFGYYPAHRAAQLNPIDALRFE